MPTDKQLGLLAHLLGRSGIAPKEEWTLPNGKTVKSIEPTMQKIKQLSSGEASELIALFAPWRESEAIRDLDLPRYYLIKKGIII